MLGVAL
jgi:hypothetical protein